MTERNDCSALRLHTARGISCDIRAQPSPNRRIIRPERQQTGEYEDAGSALGTESITVALAADLREQLIAVGRAEERIALGTYGRSVDSGASIPDDRLEAEPLAERTVEEQRLYEQRGPK